jgi:hypothetical protein
MSPEEVGRHPGFLPYALLRDELLGMPAAAWVARCNALAAQHDIRSAAAAPIRFIVGGPVQGALGYEAAVLHEGRIACRPGGRGALHDLHNALVWLTFPTIKATLNRLHLERGEPDVPEAPRRLQAPRRSRLRDLLTLLDESGLLWLSSSSRLDEQLLAKDWRGLLVANRERVTAEVLPVIIGHGLLEKLATPYKAMTAHCLVCPRPPHVGAMDLAAIDAAVANIIAARFGIEGRRRATAPVASTSASLAPLPILGLPGWDPANNDPSYYDDARIFRVDKG